MNVCTRNCARVAIVTTTSLLLVMATGCGPTIPHTVPVTGVVKYKGWPIAGATVTFRRGAGNASTGELAIAETNALGEFSLRTFVAPKVEAEGAVPAEYTVTISKYVPPNGMSEDNYAQIQAKADAIVSAGGVLSPSQEPPPKVELFPSKFSAAANTELKHSVEDAPNQRFEFDLK